MLEEDLRQAILSLHQRGQGLRAIARSLRLSRNTVKRVLASGTKEVPARERPSRLDPHRDTIAALYLECRGNLIRVHEELCARAGVTASYQALTAFCRRQRIGVVTKAPAGEYPFLPGEEMQHDTSPHTVTVGGVSRRLQCASLVLCYSRRVYAQCFARFSRFECKLFLTDAVRHFGGAATRCMVDNSHLVVLQGCGREAVFVPEMLAFAERLGFAFLAHEKGDANRSAHVERRFWHIETNFYPGRHFADLDDLNRQLLDWCEQRFVTVSRRLNAAPRDLFAIEAAALRPLPLHVPEVYRVHHHQVDEQGFINLQRNRYSAPWNTVNRWLDVREYKDKVVLSSGLDTVAVHPRLEPGSNRRSVLDEHKRRDATQRAQRSAPIPAELRLRESGPAFVAMVELLREKLPGRAVRALHRLESLQRDYPPQALVAALEEALHYGLVDMNKLEQMVLRRVAADFFKLGLDRGGPP